MCRLKMGNNVSELVPRPVYLQRIVPFMRTPVVKALIGSRRVSKSYILLQLMRHIEAEEKDANIIYINKEDLQFAEIRTYRELNDYLTQRLLPEQRNYIFIDEIQEIEEFELAIRSLALDEHNDIYITGSNSQLFFGRLGECYGRALCCLSDLQSGIYRISGVPSVAGRRSGIGKRHSLWCFSLFAPSAFAR